MNKHERKPKGQSRMDNPGIQATNKTNYTERRQTCEKISQLAYNTNIKEEDTFCARLRTLFSLLNCKGKRAKPGKRALTDVNNCY